MEIELIRGDITTLDVDIIVNAANSSLRGGGGVDGAIHRAGGISILEECMAIRDRQGPCGTGEAVMTNAGNLKAAKVIHTVGPVWNNGRTDESEKLRNCYINSLRLAEGTGLETMAFPNISTGIYNYPKKAAAAIALDAVQNHQAKNLKKVVFVCFDRENHDLYAQLMAQ